MPGIARAGGRSKAPPLDKHPQCVSQVRASAKLFNRSCRPPSQRKGTLLQTQAQQPWRGRKGSWSPGHYCINTLELKSSPWLFLSAKHEQDGEHHGAGLLSARQGSPKPDPLGHAERCGGKLVGTVQAPMLRGSVSWDRRRRALKQAWGRKPGHLPSDAKAAGMWESWSSIHACTTATTPSHHTLAPSLTCSGISPPYS